jgi:exodeoxyribonuclease-3
LASVNISGPSLDRANRLVAFLDGLDADALILTETRTNKGTEHLLAELRERGYFVSAHQMPHAGERGVALAHRLSYAAMTVSAPVELAHRLLITRLQLPRPVTLVGAYVPSRDATPAKIARKRRFLEQMARAVQSLRRDSDVILMGDLNIISRIHLPRYTAFRAWEYDALDELTELGLVDAFDELHPETQVHSWVGRTGSGYRYDYAYVDRGLLPTLVSCEYLQSTRELGLTDHAAVVLAIDGSQITIRPADRPLAFSI